ncbi:MAG: pectate lyase [Verrucomicrobiaceae bacterium]|nr:pectate lyase [Verrucomicrobiaceae bacterium]
MKSHSLVIHTLLLVTLSPGELTSRSQETAPVLKLETAADFLALHVSGIAPPGTSELEYRLAETGAVGDTRAWTAAPARAADDGAFRFDLPLKSSRWSEIQVRAMKSGVQLAKKEAHSKREVFAMLTPERIAELPEPARAAWTAYMQRSISRRDVEFDQLAAECRSLGVANASTAPANRAELENGSDTPSAWFATPKAQQIAGAIISYQTPTGGWSKAVDYSQGPRKPGTHWTAQTGEQWHYCGTFDNRTTTEQIKLLAGVFTATRIEDARLAMMRGIDYLLEAQFPNGGWPQNYPVESGYHEAITLNDNAMLHVLEVLLLIAEKQQPFAFVDDALQQRAQAAFDKGVDCLIKAQVKLHGRPAVWCAQHDPLTLEPVAARKKEPPSLSGAESAELLKFFMRKAPVRPSITAIIEPAVEWFDEHRITGLRKTKNDKRKTDYVADPESQEVYWARFYDVATARPLFAGSQDGVIYTSFHEMTEHNRVGYDYYTTKPAELIDKELARWKKRLAKTASKAKSK